MIATKPKTSPAFLKSASMRVVWVILTVALALSLLILTVLVRAYPESELDQRLLDQIGSWGDSPLRGWFDFLSLLTGQRGAIVAMGISVVVVTIIGKPNNGIAFALTLAAVGAADLVVGFSLGVFVGVERPDPESSALAFPSGHVAYVTSASLMLLYVAIVRRAKPAVLALMVAATVFLIFSVSVARLAQEAHWPSDILGGYLLGVLGPLIFIPVYHRLEKIRWVTAPRVGIDVPSPETANAIIAGSYGSAVVIEPSRGTALKYFDPPVALRALYWMSFQKSFPYIDNVDALEAAVFRRRIAGLITRYRFGKNLIAQISEIDWHDGKACMVTEYIRGQEPESNVEAWDFLSAVEVLFDEAGLPGWQLNPHNPHAHTNLVRTADGDFVIIDLESGFVTPMPALSRLRASLKQGTLPVFDDMDFDKLRQFVAQREADLHRRLGPGGYAELLDAIEKGEGAYNRWRAGEARIWGRSIRLLYRVLNIRADFAFARSGMASAQQRASGYMEKGLDRWESESRIPKAKADEIRVALKDKDMQIAMEHLGAHMLISTVLRFPIGSITRFLWTLTFMVKATSNLVRFKDDAGSGGLRIHNPIVLIWSGLPGVGAIAYIWSGPLFKPTLIRLALDETLHEMPFRIYTRLGFSKWLPPKRRVS